MSATTTERMEFSEWMRRVDAACLKRCGLSVHDLDDCCFADWHEDGVSPARAAARAIRRAKGLDDE